MLSDVSKTYWFVLKTEHVSSVVRLCIYDQFVFFGIQIDDCE